LPGAHAKRGPSGAHRWRACPVAPRREEGLPDTSGIEAALGTVFHEYAALCLEFGLEPQGFVGKPMEVEGHGILYFDQEMCDNMYYGLDYVRDYMEEPGAEWYVEVQVDIEPWTLEPGGFGTSDFFLVNVLRNLLLVFDWKYGEGVPVKPEYNDQGILYCLGVWETFAREAFEGVDPKDIDVIIVIEQPRAAGGGGVWRTTMATVLAEGELIKRDAKRCDDPNAQANPGEKQCKFCKAAALNVCKERAEKNLDLFDLKLDEVDDLAEIDIAPPLPPAVTPEQRSYILNHRPMFIKWLDQLHAEAYADAEHGRPTPNMKLVPGRAGARAWKDPEKSKNKIENRLGRDAYISKLRSPAQTEEVLGKRAFRELFEEHVTQSESKPALVPLSDPREPLKTVSERFDDALSDDDVTSLI
jgi:hypothetical protein